MHVESSGQSLGATVTHVDLAAGPDDRTIAAIREVWLERGVVAFPGQHLTPDQLADFAHRFGPWGDDPYILPIDENPHVIAVERRADEQAPIFAETWHSDWSFQDLPPAGTCLYGVVIPPTGGDTLFTDQQAALEAMPDDLRSRIEDRIAIHSARAGYAPDGAYGEADQATDRSMRIISSETAKDTRRHPLIIDHPETGVPGLFGCFGYIIGIEGMPDEEAHALLLELHAWQTRETFQYRQAWSAGQLVMWDNRRVLHRATGGYEGHHRLLHRATIGSTAETAVIAV